MTVRFDELRATANLAGIDVEHLKRGRSNHYVVRKNGVQISIEAGISNAEDFVYGYIAGHTEGHEIGWNAAVAGFKAGIERVTAGTNGNGHRTPVAG